MCICIYSVFQRLYRVRIKLLVFASPLAISVAHEWLLDRMCLWWALRIASDQSFQSFHLQSARDIRECTSVSFVQARVG